MELGEVEPSLNREPIQVALINKYTALITGCRFFFTQGMCVTPLNIMIVKLRVTF